MSDRTWTVAPEAEGERLDRHVTARIGAARNQVQKWIADRRVLLNGRPAGAATRVAAGDAVRVEPPPPSPPGRIEPQPGPLAVLYEDEHLIAIDKPAGLVVHPGAGRRSGTLVHRLLAAYPDLSGVGGPDRPGIVHRLDRDTTGVLIVARTQEAHRTLSRAFARRRVEKTYLALAWGTPPPEMIVDAPVGRHPTQRTRMTVLPEGRPARSIVSRLALAAGVAALAVRIETGRTHQIRVHLKHRGHPLLGDPVYGEKRWRDLEEPRRSVVRAFPRPALHAWRLVVPHPATGERLALEAPPPPDLLRLWEDLGGEPLALDAQSG